MRRKLMSKALFAGRSVLWSLLLYMIVMLIVNWRDLRNVVNGRTEVAIVTGDQQCQQPAISERHGLVGTIASLARIVLFMAGPHTEK